MGKLGHNIFRLTQPAGFACFLIFFLMPHQILGLALYFAGLLLTVTGIGYEVWFALKYRRHSPRFEWPVFLGSTILKLALVSFITWRVLFGGKWTIISLLVLVGITLIWNGWVFVFKRDKSQSDEGSLLDNE